METARNHRSLPTPSPLQKRPHPLEFLLENYCKNLTHPDSRRTPVEVDHQLKGIQHIHRFADLFGDHR